MSSPLLPSEISYSFKVKGSSATLSGVVVNGGPTVAKAFVAVVNMFDNAGKLIEGPYEGLHTSRLGCYRYIQGGSPNAVGKFSFKIGLPKNAVKMTVGFTPWEHSENIQFAALPVIELASAKKTAAKT